MRCREHLHYFRAVNDDDRLVHKMQKKKKKKKKSTKLPSQPLKAEVYIIQIAYFCLKPKYIQFKIIED